METKITLTLVLKKIGDLSTLLPSSLLGALGPCPRSCNALLREECVLERLVLIVSSMAEISKLNILKHALACFRTIHIYDTNTRLACTPSIGT